MIVELEKGIYLAHSGKGCHAETFMVEYAEEFDGMGGAIAALAEAMKVKPFENAQIVDAFAWVE